MFGAIADRIRKFLYEIFHKIIKEARNFFDKPYALIALVVISLKILNPLLSKLKKLLSKKISASLNKEDDPNLAKLDPNNLTDDDINNYVKRDRNLQRIMNYASNDFSESLLSDITKACENPDYYPEQYNNLLAKLNKENISEQDFLDIAEQENDFDNKVASYRVSDSLRDILGKIEGMLPWVFLTYIIILKVKEFLSQNEFPSRWRGKYIQRLIRIASTLIRSSIENEKEAVKNAPKAIKEFSQATGTSVMNEAKELIRVLGKVDSIIVASLLASFIYLQNRKNYRESSFESFSKNMAPLTCGSVEESLTDEDVDEMLLRPPEERPLQDKDFVQFSCPVDELDIPVPHKPLERKIEDFTCEIFPLEREPVSIDEDMYANLASKAIFANESNTSFNILVKKNQQITNKTILVTLDKKKIYSPISGIIEKIDKNNEKIYVRDIKDEEKTYLEKLIQDVQDKFKRQNDIKFFIKDFFIKSIYPTMIHRSPLIDEDASEEDIKDLEYIEGGVKERWENILDKWEDLKEIYEHNISVYSGEDNVKERAENNNILKLKEEIDNVEKIYYKELKKLEKRGLNQAKVTLSKKEEYSLFEYYFYLYKDTLEYFDENDILLTFRKELNKIIIRRFFIEGWNLEKLKEKINTFCNDLTEGTFFEETPDFFKEMYNKYTETFKIKRVENYIKGLASQNKEYNKKEKEDIIKKIMILFELVTEIIQKIKNEYELKTSEVKTLRREAIFIKGYFDKLWKEYYNIPKDIDNIFKTFDDLEETYIPYNIKIVDEEEYRYYGIGRKRACPIPIEDDENISPFSEYEYKDIKYWLKYCAIATLVGVTNFPLGWATGFPPPIGPIPFPVIYIPIKAFQLSWGFIVFGISITGIYPFPWVLFVNYATGYHVPIADPATIIKREITALKQKLTINLKEYKQKTLKNYLEEKQKEINNLSEYIDDYIERKRAHKLVKPKRDRQQPASVDIVRYTKELTEWKQTQLEYQEIITTSRVKKWKEELKYQMVFKSYNDVEPLNSEDDPTLKSFEESEKNIDLQFANLDNLIMSINTLLKPLPISTKPMSANFGFTLKNPRPIINFADDIDENINYGVLTPLINKFKLNGDDFLSTKFADKSQNSIINYGAYKTSLVSSMPLIIKKDPFPKYQNLKLYNLPYISFLFKDWTRIGAQTYGFPGMPQAPTS